MAASHTKPRHRRLITNAYQNIEARESATLECATNEEGEVVDQAAARVPGRPRAPLVTSRPQRPVRRALRIKTVETLPRPMTAETYVALLGVLRAAANSTRPPSTGCKPTST